MAAKKATEQVFIDAMYHVVAELGIENLRTKHVADYAGYSEATMFRFFRTKEALLQAAFLQMDKTLSDILTSSAYFKEDSDVSPDLAIYTIWRRVYRYLIDNPEQALFLIRYRYSSLYTAETRAQREAYSGAFDQANKLINDHFGMNFESYDGFLISYIFDITLCFAEKVVTGRIQDTEDTEYCVWTSIVSAASGMSRRGGSQAAEKDE